ncbi:MAG: aldo/keto reductase [Synechococcales bacterium]|nr:aldo/keto reductase [Synechococcales bacterium]
MQQPMKLGSTDVEVPALGIGTWAWGDSLFWSYGKEYGALDLEQAFQAALEHGVPFFDTAEIYGLGESEKLLGGFMKQTQQPAIIATKYMPLPWRFMANSVHDALTDSLKRLQVSQVALYQVHQPFDFFMGQSTLLEALAEEVKRGRIASVGVSNYSAEQMREAHAILAKRGVPLAVNQVQYSLLARQIETNGILDTAHELNITILAYSPLAQGLLTGKYSAETYQSPTGARWLDPRFSRSGLKKLEPLLNALREIGERRDRTPAQVSLNWLSAQGNVIPIPGAKNASQAIQNAGALGWSLDPDEVERLGQLAHAVS